MAPDHLVHDAAARPGVFVFGALTCERELGQMDRMVNEIQQPVADGNFERGRGAQPRTDRHIARDQHVRPAALKGPRYVCSIGVAEKIVVARAFRLRRTAIALATAVQAREHRPDAADVVGPMMVLRCLRRLGFTVDPDRFAVLARADHDPLVVSRRRGDPRRSIDRHRHDEAVVVVGVLADQVHATRRVVQPRRSAEYAFELAREVVGINHCAQLDVIAFSSQRESHSSGWRMKKLRTTSSTSESAGSVFHSDT